MKLNKIHLMIRSEFNNHQQSKYDKKNYPTMHSKCETQTPR
jgi:hypothetical protein